MLTRQEYHYIERMLYAVKDNTNGDNEEYHEVHFELFYTGHTKITALFSAPKYTTVKIALAIE